MPELIENIDSEARGYALNMIAVWAAQQLGKTGDQANEFVREFVSRSSPAEQHGQLFDRLSQALLARGISTKSEILESINTCCALARACFGNGKTGFD